MSFKTEVISAIALVVGVFAIIAKVSGPATACEHMIRAVGALLSA